MFVCLGAHAPECVGAPVLVFMSSFKFLACSCRLGSEYLKPFPISRDPFYPRISCHLSRITPTVLPWGNNARDEKGILLKLTVLQTPGGEINARFTSREAVRPPSHEWDRATNNVWLFVLAWNTCRVLAFMRIILQSIIIFLLTSKGNTPNQWVSFTITILLTGEVFR